MRGFNFTGNQNLGRRILGKDDGFVFREYGTGVNAFSNAEGFVTLPSGIIIVRGVTTIQLNTWYHIAMTHDGLKRRLYINGIQDGVLDAVGGTVPTSAPGVIGSDAGGNFFGQSLARKANGDRRRDRAQNCFLRVPERPRW